MSRGSARPRRGKGISRRTAARLAAVQALYEMELSGRSADSVLREFAAKRWDGVGSDPDDEPVVKVPPREKTDTGFFCELVRGVDQQARRLDEVIGQALSDDWPLDRLEAVLRAILRAGAFELSAGPEVPPRVVISEYVNLTHAFFEGSEPALANAVLDRLGHLFRPEDMREINGESGQPPR
ncbi:MAG: transcription antitermination factor NusB [Rhodospirillales bacterium]|nr:transcription antitermination factor NusB [Rhodospirillales bacterium]